MSYGHGVARPLTGPTGEPLRTLNIDGREFQIDKLPKAAAIQLASLQFVDAEIARLQSLLAVAQTARNTYAEALRATLPSS